MAMKEHMPNKADTTRLRRRTQNIFFLTSLSAVTLKLMVQIISIFCKRYLPSKFIAKSICWPPKRPFKEPGQVNRVNQVNL